MQTLLNKFLIVRAACYVGLLCALATTGLGEKLPIRVYTSGDGLGSSFVNNVMRDSRGFLWVCTRDGLSRFDGSRFVTYQVGDNRAAPPGIEQILETRKGIYWIATTGGLYRFDPAASFAVTENKGDDRPSLNATLVSDQRGVLYEDRDDNLWLGTSSLYRLIDHEKQPTIEKVDLNLPAAPSFTFGIGKICEGQDRSLWLITTWGLVRRFPNGQAILYRVNSAHSNSLSSVLQDRDGNIWVGCPEGVYIIRPEPLDAQSASGVRSLDKLAHEGPRARDSMVLPEKPGEILKYPDSEGAEIGYGNFLYQTRDGHIWISNTKSVLEFDGHNFKKYEGGQGFVEGVVQFVEDGSDNLWMSGPNGLARLDRSGLTSYLVSDGLTNLTILLVNKTRDGKPYAMSRDLSLSFFDGARFQTIRPALPPETQVLWTANPALQDSAGEWWFLTVGKLYRFAAVSDFRELARQRPLATYDSSNGLKGDRMFHIFEDSHHDLWISARGDQQEQSGLSKWSRATEKFHTFTEAEGFPSNRVTSAFAEARNGDVWIGFYEGGLVRCSGGRFTEIPASDGPPGGLITSLHVDQRGRLWIGSSQSGLSRVDDPSAAHPGFLKYTVENGLASNNVRSITEDSFGDIYVGTARGIDRLSPDTTRIKHYSISDGLAGDFVSTSFKDSNGALWFGTPNGLSRLIPNQIKPSTAPTVWVSGLRVAGERRRLSEMGSTDTSVPDIPPSQNNLQIDFFGIDFSSSEALRYQYRLEGADKDWGPPTQQRTVNYANLAPGAYRFLVRSMNADGVASTHPSVVSFRILSPIWQRWWFVASVLFLFSGAAYAAYRFRLAQMIKVERVRTRIATDLHDDIGASLSRMAILSEVVKAQHGNDGPKSEQMLSEIADSARGLVDSMSDIVWSIDPRRDNLTSLLQRLRQFASDMLESRGIDWELSAPSELERMEFSPDQRRHLYLIFKEGITNIARYADCSSARLSLSVKNGDIIAEISDNGQGFDPNVTMGSERRSGGNGLRNMQTRATELGGQLQIESIPGRGTKLRLAAPLH